MTARGDASGQDVAAAVTRYAGVFHAAVDQEHHVASPLGAWLLLALVAPTAQGPTRTRLASVLGMDPQVAYTAASALLSDPHPAIAAAAALWSRTGVGTTAFDAWQAGLPAAVARGPIPRQAGADAWAREHSLGLIDRFPLTVDSRTLVVLCTALATRISWRVPFATAPAQDLGGAWATHLSRVLVAPAGHRIGLVQCGPDLVGVHAARSADGLSVVSVIADQGVNRGRVLAVAHELGAADASGQSWDQVDLAALPLGRTGFRTVTEGTSADRRDRVIMPAWQARTDLDLLQHAGFGFTDAADALMPLLRPGERGLPAAAQAAVARYHRRGFEAAAVTGLARQKARAIRRPPARSAEIRFEHPYAVVAHALSPTPAPDAAPASASPGPSPAGWHGLPVFSAWVTDPTDADDDAL